MSRVRWNLVKVGRNYAVGLLRNKLNGYRRSWRRVYVGVTCDPERRWEKHAPNGWQRMDVLYEAYTPEIAISLERELIEYAKCCNFRLDIENVNPGGEGISPDIRSNYLYVIVAEPRRLFA